MVANSPNPDIAEDIPADDLVVLDIGKHDADALKKLRKGKGKLLRKVNNAIGQLRAAGSIDAGSQVVIVVVREKNSGVLDLFD